MDRAQTAGRILLAEDDQVLARIYCRGLQAAGYVVDTVADGAEGFDRLLATRYDVVVSDLHMPRWTGLDLLQEVRRRRPDVPFVLITGRPDSLVQAEAPQTAMVRHLFKPVSMQELAHAVDSAVALRAARIRTKNGR